MTRLAHRLCCVLFVLVSSPAIPALAKDVQPATDSSASEEYLRLYGELAEAVAQIELNSAQPVDRKRLFEAALQGMLAELDPYSTYLPPDEYSKLKELAKRNRPILGVELAVEKGRISVLGVQPGSPADQADVAPGDLLLTIGGIDTQAMTLSEAEQRLANHAGSVKLLLQPTVGPPRVIELSPARTTTPTVVGVRLFDNVGYVRINRFSGDTAEEFRTAIEELSHDGATGLVIDLRFNSGGMLNAAVDVADLLLNDGKIVSVVARRGDPREYTATAGDAWEGKPIAVLVNRYSASGSEALAAALQDHRRATVVGQRTWGKGSVQSIIPLGAGRTAIKLTTARYVRPNGANIHRSADMSEEDEWGITPNKGFEAPLAREASRELLSTWRAGKESAEPDAQLAVAIAALNQGDLP